MLVEIECEGCGGSGDCAECGGSGESEYTSDGRCRFCSTGRCRECGGSGAVTVDDWKDDPQ
jgi:hypothetical protein